MNGERLPLFRTEALDSVRPKMYGTVILLRPASFTLLTAATVLIGLLVVSFVVWGRYTTKITLRGHLYPASGMLRIDASEAGTIAGRYVSDGDEVEADQVLYVVSHDPQNAGGASRTSTYRAPQKGKVSAALATVGQHVDTGEPLVQILADDAAVEARLFAPAKDAGFIRPGSTVAIRYDLYPYQRYGVQKGTVLSVSRTPVVSSASLRESLGASTSQYLVRVSLTSQSIDANLEAQRLQAGMTLEADVDQETRRLYEWVLETPASLRRGM